MPTPGSRSASRPLLERHPGILRVFTAADVPGENSFGIYPHLKDQPVFAQAHVRHRGEPVLALVGTSAGIEAVDAAELPIAWEPLPALHGIAAALAEGAPAIHADKPDNILTRGLVETGDPDPRNCRRRMWRAASNLVCRACLHRAGSRLGAAGRDRVEVTASTQAR